MISSRLRFGWPGYLTSDHVFDTSHAWCRSDRGSRDEPRGRRTSECQKKKKNYGEQMRCTVKLCSHAAAIRAIPSRVRGHSLKVQSHHFRDCHTHTCQVFEAEGYSGARQDEYTAPDPEE